MPRQRVLALKTDGKGKPGRPTRLQEEARRQAIEAVAPHVKEIINGQVQKAIEDGRTGAARLCLEVVGVVGTRSPGGDPQQTLAVIARAMSIAAELFRQVRETPDGFVVDGEYSVPEVPPPEALAEVEEP